MTKQFLRSSQVVLVASLIVSLTASQLCGVARADDRGAEKSIRRSMAAFAPIGKVFSFGRISVNGRAVHGEQMIWGGELLEASDDSRASVTLDSIGQVTLARGAVVRLATTATNIDDDKKSSLLIATLTSGEIVVKLKQYARAYIKTRDQVFTSSIGAVFRIGIRKGQAVTDAASGVVSAEAAIAQPGSISIIRVGFQRNTGLPRDLGNEPIKQSRNKPGATGASVHSEPINALFKRRKGTIIRRVLFTPGVDSMEAQVAQDEELVTDSPVRFDLLPADIGSISQPRVRTNNAGIATTSFNAAPTAKRGKLRVTAEETGDFREWDVLVIGFWTTQNKILVGSAAAAAIVLIFIHPD